MTTRNIQWQEVEIIGFVPPERPDFTTFFIFPLESNHWYILTWRDCGTPKQVLDCLQTPQMVPPEQKPEILFISLPVNILVSNQVLSHRMMWRTTTWLPKPNVCGAHHSQNGHFWTKHVKCKSKLVKIPSLNSL